SYRELPIRYADFGRIHRYERSGVTAGLTRVRSFAQDDAHIFCRESQVGDEIGGQIAMVLDLYSHFGFDVRVGFATRPAKAIGNEPELSDEEKAEWKRIWDDAESRLEQALKDENVEYQLNEGDGAFYGPKIDFEVQDAIGRWHQLGTIQLDFSMPKRFDLKYINEEGGEDRPVMVHRAVLGSLERFIGILIEHTGGDLPLWLAPVQVRILSINDDLLTYAYEVADKLAAKGLRVKVDQRSEKLGFKIRDAELKKIQAIMVVGAKEAESGQVSVRWRKKGDLGQMDLDQAANLVLEAAAMPVPGPSVHRRAVHGYDL
ncbi:threonine--tRNA ligase, partial [Myxococcota bacterium]|nr:threonine--tRNA ligase [Myxococcota bacterium]